MTDDTKAEALSVLHEIMAMAAGVEQVTRAAAQPPSARNAIRPPVPAPSVGAVLPVAAKPPTPSAPPVTPPVTAAAEPAGKGRARTQQEVLTALLNKGGN